MSRPLCWHSVPVPCHHVPRKNLLAWKAKEDAVQARRSAIEKQAAPTDSLAATLAEAEKIKEESVSDTDSDLDGGDDDEVTETAVWLGTFEVQRTREWPARQISMAPRV